MYLLSKDGSRHLLEFLRNLTPQVLLISSALIVYVVWRSDPGAYFYLAGFIGLSAMCVLAAVANSNNFMDNAFSHSAAIAAERDRLSAASVHGVARLRAITAYIWREKPSTVVELIAAMLLVYGSLIVILVASFTTAMKVVQ